MKRLQERRLEHQDPEILTPDQMRACLEAADGERRLLAYLALGGFAGMRTEEILRQSWSDIDWEAGEIYVRQPKRVGGWRPRHVEILPALRRHLEHLALKEGKVLPGGQRTLYLVRRAMMDKLGWEVWPRNCLRHSFKTYHAAHFQDLPKLAVQMGHAGSSLTITFTERQRRAPMPPRGGLSKNALSLKISLQSSRVYCISSAIHKRENWVAAAS